MIRFATHEAAAAALLLASLFGAAPAAARTGFGDPIEVYREHEPGERVELDGHLRWRGAMFSTLDLNRGGDDSLWPQGEGDGDLTFGNDLRLRLTPSFFFRDDVRVKLEVDVVDNATLGASPSGTPYDGRPAIVAGTVNQDPYTFRTDIFSIRTAMGEVLTPFGVLSAGRMPSHFGLGIAANNGDDLDDDGGDRADRVAFTTPIVGHYLSIAFDWAATGPTLGASEGVPDPQLAANQHRAISVALLRYRAPWEVDLRRAGGRAVLDYGLAFSGQWQPSDVPLYYQTLDPSLAQAEDLQVARDYRAFVWDLWLRFVAGNWRVEAEAVVVHLEMGNPSPYAGVTYREGVVGNPVGAVLQVEWSGLAPELELLAEVGVASADPGYGFPYAGPSEEVGGEPGDLRGSQLDGSRDRRMDAFTFNPAYRVDLILWRTLLDGVSESAYTRLRARYQVLEPLQLELNAVYSHHLHGESAPGGIGPLGLELDLAAVLEISGFSLRLDYGVLFPFGGLGTLGGARPTPANLVLVRLGYAT